MSFFFIVPTPLYSFFLSSTTKCVLHRQRVRSRHRRAKAGLGNASFRSLTAERCTHHALRRENMAALGGARGTAATRVTGGDTAQRVARYQVSPFCSLLFNIPCVFPAFVRLLWGQFFFFSLYSVSPSPPPPPYIYYMEIHLFTLYWGH
jgi:hypothetical protein